MNGHCLDPYEEMFAHYGGVPDPHAALTDKQWRRILAELVAGDLLDQATATRFTADFNGARSLVGFQEQLVQWVPPPNESLRSLDDVVKTLDDSTSFIERMLSEAKEGECRRGEASVPQFIPRALSQMQQVSAALEAAQMDLRRELQEETRNAQLFGSKRHLRDSTATRTTRLAVNDAWQFQREHASFLLKEERRRRAIRVERHNTDESSRQVLVESFPSRLAAAHDISVWMGSATVPESDSAKESREQTKKELVVVLSLKRRHARADEIAWLDNAVHAHRELLLSPYYQQYLGGHEVLSTDRGGEVDAEHLYCFELAPVTSLEVLLEAHRKLFEENSLLLRYFAREILLAMVDFHDQSTHTLQARLTPQNVLLSPSRRRVLLGKLDFGPSLDAIQLRRASITKAHAARETELLSDLALFLFAMGYQTTLPSNLDAFRTEYLPRVVTSDFTSEFVFSDVNPTTSQLCVSKNDRFSIVLLMGSPMVSWLLQSKPHQLELWEQTASPLPAFTFVACEPGQYQLVFVPLDRGASPVARIILEIRVVERSYVFDPPTRLTTLIQNCTQLSLRRLLETHELFEPFTESEMHGLDLLLEQCRE